MHTNSNKIQIHCAENCGNSPKKQLLKELTIALVKNEIDVYLEHLAEHVVWEIVGDRRIEGKECVEKTLDERKYAGVQELTIHNIITHGNTGAVNGTVRLNEEHSIAFCDVYNFSGFGKKAKIKQVTSYIIESVEAVNF